MYYGASLFTSINPSICSFWNIHDLKTSVDPYRGVLRPTTKFVKFVNEIGGAVRRESAAELE